MTKKGVAFIFFVFTDGIKRKGKKMHLFSVPPDSLCMSLSKMLRIAKLNKCLAIPKHFVSYT
jgi:hypothetical protein